MSRVRFQLLFGPPASHPHRMSWSQRADEEDTDPPGPEADEWYCWRLIGANNRELGRSARSFDSYPGARRAVRYMQQHTDRLVRATVVNPANGRWGWRLDLDDRAVAVSGRWYERDHDSRLGMDKFINLVPGAELAHGVVTMHDRRRNAS